MSIFDTLHSFTDSVGAREVSSNIAPSSTLVGSVLITLGLIQQVIPAYKLKLSDAKWIVIGLLFMFVVAWLYRLTLPGFATNEQSVIRFSALAHFSGVNMAALLIGVFRPVLYKLYRETGQVLMLVVASFLILFAQSALLFKFSNMWDFSWWFWHGVRIFFWGY